MASHKVTIIKDILNKKNLKKSDATFIKSVLNRKDESIESKILEKEKKNVFAINSKIEQKKEEINKLLEERKAVAYKAKEQIINNEIESIIKEFNIKE